MAETTKKEQDEVKQSEDATQIKIETAVKFLQNPRVKDTPLGHKKAFLAKKGLASNEIAQALKLSGTSEQVRQGHISPSRLPAQGQDFYPVQTVPHPARWRDYFMAAVIGGGFGYALVHLVKAYILPYFSGQKDEYQVKMVELQSTVCELKENINEKVSGIQDTLDSVQKMLQEQQQKFKTLSLSLSTSQSCLTQSLTDSYSLSEVKSELSSLKGLLLSRRQFPSPVVQSTPGIPAWQRNEASVPAVVPPSNTGDQADIPLGGNAVTKPASSGTCLLNQHTASVLGDTAQAQNTRESNTGEDVDDDGCFQEQSDTSSSTLSSNIGSPNLSLNEMRESLSETYVKVPTNE